MNWWTIKTNKHDKWNSQPNSSTWGTPNTEIKAESHSKSLYAYATWCFFGGLRNRLTVDGIKTSWELTNLPYQPARFWRWGFFRTSDFGVLIRSLVPQGRAYSQKNTRSFNRLILGGKNNDSGAWIHATGVFLVPFAIFFPRKSGFFTEKKIKPLPMFLGVVGLWLTRQNRIQPCWMSVASALRKETSATLRKDVFFVQGNADFYVLLCLFGSSQKMMSPSWTCCFGPLWPSKNNLSWRIMKLINHWMMRRWSKIFQTDAKTWDIGWLWKHQHNCWTDWTHICHTCCSHVRESFSVVDLC